MYEKKEKIERFCVGHECENGGNICCRDCEMRFECVEVCDGPENGSVDDACEWRI